MLLRFARIFDPGVLECRVPDEVVMSLKQSVFPAGRGLMACIIAIPVLLGCSKKNDGTAAGSSSQVVARIGNQVISAQELDTELRWNNVAADRKHDDAVVKRVLAELAARKYLVEKSLDAKLDREPTVLLDILRSREQVLARAFAMRELSREASAISAADTQKYIVDHPLKFANRKILSVDQTSFAIGSTDQSSIDSMKSFPSVEKVEERLTELGIPHTRSAATLSTSEIPDELFRSLQETGPGTVVFFRSGQNGVFLTVTREELRPLEGDAAIALARQLQQQDIARAQASLTNFTASMEAKYEGEYARIMREPAPDATN
jgi:EpsD family peptidyl-prolyl cis-trans isomerase